MQTHNEMMIAKYGFCYDDIPDMVAENKHNMNPYELFTKEKHTCPVCKGTGELRVEDFNPVSTQYSDYDVTCDECEGTGEISGGDLLDKLA